MSIPYDKIIETFRAKHNPCYLSVRIEFANCMTVEYGASLKLQSGDKIVYSHNIADKSLTNTLEWMVRLANVTNGRD